MIGAQNPKEASMILRQRSSFCLIPLVIMAISTSLAGQPKQNLSVDTLLEWHSVGDPAISPDGSRIAYTLRWQDKIEDKSYSHILPCAAGDEGGREARARAG